MSTLARTDDTVQASAQLTGLSSQIPSGSEGLPRRGRTTSRSIGLIPRGRPSRPSNGSSRPALASGLHRRRQPTGIRVWLDDLHHARPGREGVGTPVLTPTPPGTGPLRACAHAESRQREDSEHDGPGPGGHSLSERLAESGNPTSPRRSRRREIRRALQFRHVDRRLHDDEHQPGRRAPKPGPRSINIDLSQPLNGYDGTLFSISLLGPYFNVNFS